MPAPTPTKIARPIKVNNKLGSSNKCKASSLPNNSLYSGNANSTATKANNRESKTKAIASPKN